MKIDRNCHFCGESFSVHPSALKRGGKFCSKSCQVKDQHRNGTNKAARKGRAHHNWGGGFYIDPDGYRRVRVAVGKYQMEHIKVAESVLGRRLKRNEVVHHLDECRTNNSVSNLAVMNRGEHVVLHRMANRLRKKGDHSKADQLLRLPTPLSASASAC